MDQQAGQIEAPPFRITWAAASDTGHVRPQNEDAFSVTPDIPLFIVSDGMGGHEEGELAAHICTEFTPERIQKKLAKLRSKRPKALRRLIRNTFPEVNHRVLEETVRRKQQIPMGATLTLMLIKNNRACVGHLGDSRAYRLRGPRFTQLTSDHTSLAELTRKQAPPTLEILVANLGAELTRYIGIDAKATPQVKTFLLQPHDRILLCSDGLSDALPDNQIKSVLKNNPDLPAACQRLIQAANNHGGHDNITTLLLQTNPL